MFKKRKKETNISDLRVQQEMIKEHQRVLNNMTNSYNSIF